MSSVGSTDGARRHTPDARGDVLTLEAGLAIEGHGDPETPRPFGGLITEVNGAISRTLNLKTTERNIELFHFCGWRLRVVLPLDQLAN
jgi:hypothetical protein